MATTRTMRYLTAVFLVLTSVTAFVPEKFHRPSCTSVKAVEASEVILPCLIFGSAFIATAAFSDKPTFDVFKVYEDIQEPVIENKKEVVEPKPEPVPAPSKPVAVPEPVTVAVQHQQQQQATPERVVQAASSPGPKSLNQLVKEVGRTVDENKKVQQIVEKRKAEANVQAAANQEQEKQEEPQADESFIEEPQRGKKRKLVARVIKKAIAPWRKWENIK